MKTVNDKKERPILFSGPAVRAILEDRMTQTRRVAKKLNPAYLNMHCGTSCPDWKTNREAACKMWCPYGKPGDRLWVQENYRIYLGNTRQVFYDATPEIGWQEWTGFTEEELDKLANRKTHVGNCTPGRLMYRSLSRLTLEIVSVRVDRLREISWDDAKAEGLESCSDDNYHGWKLPNGEMVLDPKDAFAELWESINGPGSWEENPWVWVVEFKKLEGGAV